MNKLAEREREKRVRENRGARLHNVTNIEHRKANDWWGETGSDGRFSRFDTVRSGLRAERIILDQYRKRGIDTIKRIVETRTPRKENGNKVVDADIALVSKIVGKDPNTPLKGADYDRLLKAVALYGTGYRVTDDDIRWVNEHMRDPRSGGTKGGTAQNARVSGTTVGNQRQSGTTSRPNDVKPPQPAGPVKHETIERSVPGKVLHGAATLGAGVANGVFSPFELMDAPFEYARRRVKPNGWVNRALDFAEDVVNPGMKIARPILGSKAYRQFQDYAKPENAFENILNATGELVPDAALSLMTGGGPVLAKLGGKQLAKFLAKKAVKEVLVPGIPSGLARQYYPENKWLDPAAQFTANTMLKARAAKKALRKSGGDAVDFNEMGKDIAKDGAEKGKNYLAEMAAGKLRADRGPRRVPPDTSSPDSGQQERRTYIGTSRDGRSYPPHSSAPAWPGRKVPFPWRVGLRQWDGTPARDNVEVMREYLDRAGGDYGKALDLLTRDGWYY